MKAERAPLLGLIAGLVLIAATRLPWPTLLIWNRTASVPPGLYAVSPAAAIARGDLVAYRPGPSEAAWIAARGYTGKDWPLIKRIAALEGDVVCRLDQTILVDGAVAALALERDAKGSALPVWTGCRRLGPCEVFLLADHPRSIDGRYLGVQPSRRILGKVARIWTRPDDQGPPAPSDQPRPLPHRTCSADGLDLVSAGTR